MDLDIDRENEVLITSRFVLGIGVIPGILATAAKAVSYAALTHLPIHSLNAFKENANDIADLVGLQFLCMAIIANAVSDTYNHFLDNKAATYCNWKNNLIDHQITMGHSEKMDMGPGD